VRAAGGVASAAWADEPPPPTGTVTPPISGALTRHNRGSDRVFDRPMLEAPGASSSETAGPGVLMRTPLRSVGALGKMLVVTVTDDEATQVPLTDFAQHDVLLTLKRDGNRVSDERPPLIVYPNESDAELRRQSCHSRSAWQVAEMQVV
jgi:hypothetical protein